MYIRDPNLNVNFFLTEVTMIKKNKQPVFWGSILILFFWYRYLYEKANLVRMAVKIPVIKIPVRKISVWKFSVWKISVTKIPVKRFSSGQNDLNAAKGLSATKKKQNWLWRFFQTIDPKHFALCIVHTISVVGLVSVNFL